MPSYPRGSHRVSGSREYRRVIGAVQQNNDTGTGSGSSGTPAVLTYAQTVAVDSPKGYWKMDEASGNLADSSGSGLTLTTHGSPTYGGTGPGTGQKCVTFVSASSQYFDRASATQMDVGDVLTLELWYKRSAVQGTNQTFLTRFATNTYNFYMTTANKIHLDKYNTTSVVDSTGALTDTASWHHIVLTKNGATVKIYLDNADVTGTVTNATFTNASSVIVMASKETTTTFLNGSLSHVAVYATDLSAARVSAHYAAMV